LEHQKVPQFREGGLEILHYNFRQLYFSNPEEYFVKIANGRAESYGKMGDFDSTKNPIQDIKNKALLYTGADKVRVKTWV
jgi:hypothetical protein